MYRYTNKYTAHDWFCVVFISDKSGKVISVDIENKTFIRQCVIVFIY